MERLKELYEIEAFFELPIAGLFEEGMAPMNRDQPNGFSDNKGIWWHAILSDGVLKRQEI